MKKSKFTQLMSIIMILSLIATATPATAITLEENGSTEVATETTEYMPEESTTTQVPEENTSVQEFEEDITTQESTESITAQEFGESTTTQEYEENTSGNISEENNVGEMPISEEGITEEKIDFTNPEDSIDPQWSISDHKNDICAYVASQLNLTSSQKSWIQTSCAAADSAYKDVRAFHARIRVYGSDKDGDGNIPVNYLAALKALWMFARLIGTENKTQTVLNNLPNVDSKNREYIKTMCQTVQSYLKSQGSITKEHKQYLVYGFALHLIGDIYAHRILVKKTCVDNEHWNTKDTSTNKYFQSKDFAEPQKLQNNVLNGTVYTQEIKTYMKKNATFSINDGTGTTNKANKVYTDNKTFMPKRFAAAKKASVSFMTHVRKSGGDFSDVSFYRDTYSLTIQSFATYKASIN